MSSSPEYRMHSDSWTWVTRCPMYEHLRRNELQNKCLYMWCILSHLIFLPWSTKPCKGPWDTNRYVLEVKYTRRCRQGDRRPDGTTASLGFLLTGSQLVRAAYPRHVSDSLRVHEIINICYCEYEDIVLLKKSLNPDRSYGEQWMKSLRSNGQWFGPCRAAVHEMFSFATADRCTTGWDIGRTIARFKSSKSILDNFCNCSCHILIIISRIQFTRRNKTIWHEIKSYYRLQNLIHSLWL